MHGGKRPVALAPALSESKIPCVRSRSNQDCQRGRVAPGVDRVPARARQSPLLPTRPKVSHLGLSFSPGVRSEAEDSGECPDSIPAEFPSGMGIFHQPRISPGDNGVFGDSSGKKMDFRCMKIKCVNALASWRPVGPANRRTAQATGRDVERGGTIPPNFLEDLLERSNASAEPLR